MPRRKSAILALCNGGAIRLGDEVLADFVDRQHFRVLNNQRAFPCRGAREGRCYKAGIGVAVQGRKGTDRCLGSEIRIMPTQFAFSQQIEIEIIIPGGIAIGF